MKLKKVTWGEERSQNGGEERHLFPDQQSKKRLGGPEVEEGGCM